MSISYCIKPVRKKTLADQQGFTLLEMVLVLLIMGMVASLSVVFIDNEDNQLRYEESVQKLEIMHKSTVTIKDYKDDFLMSGFVVDNGVLPGDAKDYVSIPVDWIRQGETFVDNSDPLNPVSRSRIRPYFRLTAKDLATNIDFPNGGYTLLPATLNSPLYLKKGYRAGYISLGIDSAGNYKDAWGNDFVVSEDANHELDLAIDLSTKTETTASFIGDDNNDGVSNINENIPKDNWSIRLADLQIKLVNESTVPENDPNNNIIVGMIVFKNTNFIRPNPSLGDDTENCKSCWVTYHFKKQCLLSVKTDIQMDANSLTPPLSDSIFLSNENTIWQTEALEKTENDQTTCTNDEESDHADNTDRWLAMNQRIPAGEHIIFVGVDRNNNGLIEGNDSNGNGRIERLDLNGDGDYGDPNELDEFDEFEDIDVIKVIPRFTQPTVTLVIAP